MITASPILLTVEAVKAELDDVKTFTLRPDTPFSYEAGQFLTLLIPQSNGSVARRPYSLSSTPTADPLPAITVKRVENGLASRLLFDRTHPGDRLQALGPAGLFLLPDRVPARDVFFFWAAGVGITPMLPLIRTLLGGHPAVDVRLIYSNRRPEGVLFGDRLDALEATHTERFRQTRLYSTAKNLNRARLHRALIPELLRELAGDVPSARQWHYICGPLDYRRMAAWGLEEAGIPARRIRKEIFQVDAPVAKPLPPDRMTHTVYVEETAGVSSFPVIYPDSILKAASKAGVALPYSCEAGRCGTCALRCVSGRIWQSYNEVLTDAEIEAGLVLTCTGHPMGGDVTLRTGLAK